MDWKLEAVVVPVSDVERSRAFYVDQLGFRLDTDHHGGAQHFEAGVMVPGPDPDRASYASFIFFSDPDGNTWAVQEIREHVR